MNDREFIDWCQNLKLSPNTVELIKSIRAAPPSRRVQGRAGNVSGVYPSRKMGQTIQFESHKVELWAIYQMEHDSEVLEFYDQPQGFKIKYKNAAGRTIGHYHTPDFFVLRKTEAGWEEWKTEKQLILLSQKYPTRYQKTLEGIWRFPPGEKVALELGLKYYVRSDAIINPVYIQNLIFLEDYLKFNVSIPTQLEAQVKTIVSDNPGITIPKILSNLDGARANDLYNMIALEQIYTDLFVTPLVNSSSVQLYINKATHDDYVLLKQVSKPSLQTESERLRRDTAELPLTSSKTLETNTLLNWDGKPWTLINQGQTTTTLLPEKGQPIQLNNEFFKSLLVSGLITKLVSSSSEENLQGIRDLISAASPKDLEEANRRLSTVQAYMEGNKSIDKNLSERTIRQWVKQFREATKLFNCGYVGLLPKINKRGNRLPKAPQNSLVLLDSFLKEHFETSRQAPAASVYRAYKKACSSQQITAVSRSTFYQRLKKRRTPEYLRKRYGDKVIYNQSAWYWELNSSTPRHGERPLDIVHIDHTQLDIELRSSSTGRLLGRPWMTLLTDAYTRRILAVYLTFDPPSYRSCMMTLRICVQRFARFPSTVVVDGGKEFHSVYFDTLLARYHCIKKNRPGAKPRFGSVIERLFNTTNTQFIFNLLGNTQASKQPRTLTKKINPKEQAVWTLGDLYIYLLEWAYSIYDTTVHPAHNTTPRNAYEQGLILTGEREHRHISYDEDFILATHPSSKTGVAQIQPGRGIKLHYLYYWSEAFRNSEVERTKVSVRYDPFDIGVAYAYVQGRWVKCISQYYSIFEGRSEKELFLASQEIKQQFKVTNKKISISALQLADFLTNVQKHEAVLLQRLRDLEGKNVVNTLNYEPMTPSKMPLESNDSNITPSSIKTEYFPSSVELSSLPIFEEYH